MSDQIVRFEDRVKERMKEIVADLIPDDKWGAIVSATVSEFERVDLPNLVKAELTQKYKQLIQDEFKKPEWQQRFNGSIPIASEMVQKLILESAPLILAGMIGGYTQQVVYDLQNKIQRY
jgi:hypothetical protein